MSSLPILRMSERNERSRCEKALHSDRLSYSVASGLRPDHPTRSSESEPMLIAPLPPSSRRVGGFGLGSIRLHPLCVPIGRQGVGRSERRGRGNVRRRPAWPMRTSWRTSGL